MSDPGVVDMWARAVCGVRLVFPLGDGYRLSSQRPQLTSPKLEGWLRSSVRLFSFMLIWAAAYFLLSVTRRSVLIGVVVNPIYIGAALVGIYGCLTLNYKYVAIAIITALCLSICFLAFIFLNYAGSVRADDERAWVVLALFLPAVIVDFLTALAVVPFLRALLAAERAERAPPADVEVSSSTGVVTPVAIDVEDPTRPRVCPVCMERPPDTVLLKCKHMVCAQCAPRLPEKRCPICRQKYSSTMKVFLG